MFGLQTVDIITIVVYFTAVIGIGIWASRRIRSQEDYFLGGRRFGKLVQTFAMFGQGTSAESAVGVTVTVARNGVAGIGQAMLWVFLMPLNWVMAAWHRRMRVLTLGDFYEVRYKSKGLAAIYAVMGSMLFMIVIGMGFTAMTRTVCGITAKPIEKLTVQERSEYERALEWDKLENTDRKLLSSQQSDRIDRLRIEKPSRQFSYVNENVLMWTVALIVLIYAVAGGLEAAFLTDMLQGMFIIILSCLLFPFACLKINANFDGQGVMGIIEIARSRLSEATFSFWGSPEMTDFTWYYLIAIMIMYQFNIFVLANNLTSSGAAKDDYTAQIGGVTGMYIKRVCYLLWGITALFLIVLYSGTVSNADYLFGYACRDLLGSVGIGLVGLMIACLMAAVMSTADCLMITASSLLTHNLFRPLFPNLGETAYVWVGRFLGFVVVVGGALIASQFDNIFQMLKILWEWNIVFAASFLLGLKWRKANKMGAWLSVVGSLIMFYVLPVIIPMCGDLRTNPYLLKTVEPIETVKVYRARQIDVENRQEKIERWDKLDQIGQAQGDRPEPFSVGQKFEKLYMTPKKSIFWTKGFKSDHNGEKIFGSGMLNIDLVFIDKCVFDLSKNPYALNETIRVIIRTIVPFAILVVVSLLTKPDKKQHLDRFYALMLTPVYADKQKDLQEVKLSCEQPDRFKNKKLWPNSEWEFHKLSERDLKAIVWMLLFGLFLFIGTYWLISLGRS